MKNNNEENFLRDFIIDWNLRYPYDRFWRKKYNVSFGSSEHLQMDHLHMAVDLLEDKMMKHYQTEQEIADFNSDFFNAQLPEEYQNLQNQDFKIVKDISAKELDKDFNDLDLSQFND